LKQLLRDDTPKKLISLANLLQALLVAAWTATASAQGMRPVGFLIVKLPLNEPRA